jgi:hypothetical protein
VTLRGYLDRTKEQTDDKRQGVRLNLDNIYRSDSKSLFDSLDKPP